MFDTNVEINNIISPTKQIEELDESIKKQNNDNDIPNNNSLSDSNDEKIDNKKSKIKETIDFFIPIVIAMVVAILLKSLVFANATVPTESMVNTIQADDRIIASRLAYYNNDPERYDIVIFFYPDDESTFFVKRIIGLPGETVEIIDGIVYVTTADGETSELDDSFVTNCVPTGNFGPYKVPEDSYFMMGDNRNNSWDSRYWNNTYVKRDKIVGKVMFRYYPNISKIE